MTTTDVIVIEPRGETVLVGLNRPEHRNALNDEMIAALTRFFVRPPEDARVVVLHGLGENFCAGLDLKEFVAKRRSEHDFRGPVRRMRSWHQLFDLIQFGEIPVVSVLKGAVMGGGLELASATHVRVSEPSTFYALPEGQHGISLGGGGSVRIPRLIGTARVMDMMLTGRRYDAEAGLTLGLAQHGAEEGGGLELALKLAARIAGNAASSNFAITNGLARIQEMGYAEGLFAETAVAAIARSDGDSSQRITRFFDDRKQARRVVDAVTGE